MGICLQSFFANINVQVLTNSQILIWIHLLASIPDGENFDE